MMRGAAALVSLLCFGLAWMAGVLADHPPPVRLGRGVLALILGLCGGALCGALLRRLLLGELARQTEKREGES